MNFGTFIPNPILYFPKTWVIKIREIIVGFFKKKYEKWRRNFERLKATILCRKIGNRDHYI